MNRRTSELSRLTNIGAVTEAWLNEAGFSTETELREVGAVLAYRIVKHQRPAANLNLSTPSMGHSGTSIGTS